MYNAIKRATTKRLLRRTNEYNINRMNSNDNYYSHC